MIKLAFFIGGIVLIPALSALNLWLIITLGTVGLIVDILLCGVMAVVLTVVSRKIQQYKRISAAGLLISATLLPLLAAILLLIIALNSSLQEGLGIFFQSLTMLITDILIMGMTAFGIWDNTEGDKTKTSDNDNSNPL